MVTTFRHEETTIVRERERERVLQLFLHIFLNAFICTYACNYWTRNQDIQIDSHIQTHQTFSELDFLSSNNSHHPDIGSLPSCRFLRTACANSSSSLVANTLVPSVNHRLWSVSPATSCPVAQYCRHDTLLTLKCRGGRTYLCLTTPFETWKPIYDSHNPLQ